MLVIASASSNFGRDTQQVRLHGSRHARSKVRRWRRRRQKRRLCSARPFTTDGVAAATTVTATAARGHGVGPLDKTCITSTARTWAAAHGPDSPRSLGPRLSAPFLICLLSCPHACPAVDTLPLPPAAARRRFSSSTSSSGGGISDAEGMGRTGGVRGFRRHLPPPTLMCVPAAAATATERGSDCTCACVQVCVRLPLSLSFVQRRLQSLLPPIPSLVPSFPCFAFTAFACSLLSPSTPSSVLLPLSLPSSPYRHLVVVSSLFSRFLAAVQKTSCALPFLSLYFRFQTSTVCRQLSHFRIRTEAENTKNIKNNNKNSIFLVSRTFTCCFASKETGHAH